MPSSDKQLRDRVHSQIARYDLDELTRWDLRGMLNGISALIAQTLKNQLSTDVGCSILVREKDDRYFVAGASSSWETRARSAEQYNLNDEAPDHLDRQSVTGYALRHRLHLSIDDFPEFLESSSDTIRHQPKRAELWEKETQSFYLCPAFARQHPQALNRLPSSVRVRRPLPTAGIRISAATKGTATRVQQVLDATTQRIVFRAIEKARQSALNRDASDVIAELQADLLQYRRNEFEGLEQLAYYLQSLYVNSHASVFLTHRDFEKKRLTLNLAATTAWTDTVHHRKLRETFFKNGECYSVTMKDGRPEFGTRLGRTIRTLTEQNSVVNEVATSEQTEGLRSNQFEEAREIDVVGSFLAVAIPRERPDETPYGVVRILRKTRERFSEAECQLVSSIARSLSRWLGFFPKKETLKIKWREQSASTHSSLKERLIRGLYGLTNHDPVPADYANEVDWLMQKIFFQSDAIEIADLLGGRSGAALARVRNDSGLDLVLKCEAVSERPGRSPGAIEREIRNYQEHIEGKLPLSHNVIYRDLVRETRRLRGFATSLVGAHSGERISVSKYCSSQRATLMDIERTLTRVIERFVGETWSFFYRTERMEQRKSRSALAFLRDEFLSKDPLFDFFDCEGKLDERTSLLQPFFLESGYDFSFVPAADLWKSFLELDLDALGPIDWYETVTHGDAHGGNLSFDPRSMNTWIIDFERTGRRCACFDLVHLESDVRFSQYWSIVQPLADPNRRRDWLRDFHETEKIFASQDRYEMIPIPVADKDHRSLAAVCKVAVDIRQLACMKLRLQGPFLDYRLLSIIMAFMYMQMKHVPKEVRALAYLSARAQIDAVRDWTLRRSGVKPSDSESPNIRDLSSWQTTGRT